MVMPLASTGFAASRCCTKWRRRAPGRTRHCFARVVRIEAVGQGLVGKAAVGANRLGDVAEIVERVGGGLLLE